MKKYSLTLASQLDKIEEAALFIEKALINLRYCPKNRDNIVIAATEAITNAIIHGNKNDPKKTVQITVEGLNDRIVIHVKDQGKGFHLHSIHNPLAPENIMRENGRGILILKSLMDDITFNFSPDGTEIVLTKYKSGKK
ncbi:MAG: ATP-binding protein [Calditrichaeota bacterium]|nr:ATP-binding protein [Calditrichota bacterium]